MKNKNDISVMLKEAGILFAITLFAGLLLGVVNELTKEPIRIQQEKAIQEACRAVFADAASFEEMEYTMDAALTQELSGMGVKLGTVYQALGGDNAMLGYVLESTSTQGYGGNIVLYLGVRADGTLNDISILEISETAGLGMLAPEVLVPQFHDKKVESFVYTKAVTNAVNGGLKAAERLLEGGAGNE